MQSSARAPVNPNVPAWPTPSHTATFVRNLRLLRLNQQDDWPDITVRTFGASQYDSRQRVKAVEWSLYHLFMIWDPEGTQNV